MKHRLLAAIAALVLSVIALPSEAAFHNMKVTQVFAGSVLAPNAQYIELQMWTAGQNFVSGHAVQIYNAADVMVGQATFPANVPNGANQSRILIATAEAEALFGITADLTMMPSIIADGGKVCFEGIDCVAWGSYSGSGMGVGTPFAAATGIPLGRAIRRDVTIAGGMTTLENADDTGNSANDFDAVFPSPHNNANETGFPPAALCGNATTESLES